MGIYQATLSRWNDTGLNSSICRLVWVHPDSNDYGGTSEEDADSVMPRAEYYFDEEKPDEFTVSYTLRQARLVFNVWLATGSALETALDLIEAKYDNSWRAGTDPFAITNGTVTRVQFMGRESGPVDENVFTGSLEFEVEWQKTSSVPA